MPTQGLYYPSKVVQVAIDPSRTVSTPFSLDPTYSLPSSQVWYIQPNGSGSKLRVQDPLLFNNDPTIIWSTASAAALGASFSGMILVTVTSSGTNWPAGTPDIGPLWINTAFIGGVTTTSSGATRILLGTNGPAEFITVSETEAAILTAASAASINSVTVPIPYGTGSPLGSTQGTARAIQIPQGVQQLLYQTTGLSTPIASGFRLEAINLVGVVVPPAVGTVVTIDEQTTLLPVNIYPHVGGNIVGLPVNVPLILKNGMNITLRMNATNTWEVNTNTFGTVYATGVSQLDDAEYLVLGSGPGLGILVQSAVPSLAQCMIALGVTDTGLNYGGTGLQIVSGGLPGLIVKGNSTVLLGGENPGEEGNMACKVFNIDATTPGVSYSPKRFTDIVTATGLTPALLFVGDEGSECFIRNSSGSAVELRDVGNALIATIAPGASVHIVSFDLGSTWGVVSTF